MPFKAKRAQGESGNASLIRVHPVHLWLKKQQNLRLREGLGLSASTPR